MSDADYMGTQFDRFDSLKSMKTAAGRLHGIAQSGLMRPAKDCVGADRAAFSTHGRGPRPQIGGWSRILSRSDTSSQVPANRLRGRNEALHDVAEFFHFVGF
jgi:hypothetical protein